MILSAPLSIAFLAKRSSITSWSVIPPQPCTASLSSTRAPSEVMTIGTFHLAHTPMSCSNRSFERWTIWLTANGAAGVSGWSRSQAASASLISCSHSSSCDWGRALRAGKLPTIPLVHWAITSFGLETMNIGAPMTGMRRCDRMGGRLSASDPMILAVPGDEFRHSLVDARLRLEAEVELDRDDIRDRVLDIDRHQ